MRGMIIFAGPVLALTLISGCSLPPASNSTTAVAGTRIVWIVKDGSVSRSYTVNPDGGSTTFSESNRPKPGDVLLFRSEMRIFGTSGKTGEAYSIAAPESLRKIGEFRMDRTDEDLTKEYSRE